MTAQPAAPPLTPIELARLDSDLPCLVCQYNLRHQPAEGLCPECATPVEQSLRSPLLIHAPSPWVAQLARGSWALAFSSLLGALHITLHLASLEFGEVVYLYRYLFGPLVAMHGVVFLFGVVLITIGEPGVPPSARVRRATRRLRSAATLCLPLMLLIYGPYFHLRMMRIGVVGLSLVGLGVASAVANFLSFSQQRRLARRIPSEPLERVYGWMRWIFLAASITSLVIVFMTGARTRYYAELALIFNVVLLALDLITFRYNLQFAQSLSETAAQLAARSSQPNLPTINADVRRSV